MTRTSIKTTAAAALLTCATLVGGCKTEGLLEGLTPSPSAVLLVLDQSGSCWEQVKPVAAEVAPLCTHVSKLGPKSPGALMTGGQGANWEMEICGERRATLREKVAEICKSEGRVGEWGSDICAMLDRVKGFAEDAGEGRLLVVVVSDFVADPPQGARAGLRRPYRDPAEYTWKLPHPEKTTLCLYFTQDAEYERLRAAWQPQLTGVDARFFRPGHVPSLNDMERRPS